MATYNQAVELIRDRLGRDKCWCPFGIGHPSYNDHTGSCKEARQLIENWDKEHESTNDQDQ